jgi:hypothetical protein
MFSTIEAAIDYIQGKLTDFYDRRFEMQNIYDQARINLQDAYAQNRMIEDAKQSLADVLSALQDYNDLSDNLKPLASALNVETGMGFFPVAVTTAIYFMGGITAVILAAELLYNYYQKLQVQRVVVQQIKDGLLPASAGTKPSVVQQLTSMTGALGNLLLIGLGGLFLYKVVK